MKFVIDATEQVPGRLHFGFPIVSVQHALSPQGSKQPKSQLPRSMPVRLQRQTITIRESILRGLGQKVPNFSPAGPRCFHVVSENLPMGIWANPSALVDGRALAGLS